MQPGYGQHEASGMSRWEDDLDDDPHFSRYRAEHLSEHDRHYRAWRDEQARRLREDYEKYRAERQSKWSSDFASWRDRQPPQASSGSGSIPGAGSSSSLGAATSGLSGGGAQGPEGASAGASTRKSGAQDESSKKPS